MKTTYELQYRSTGEKGSAAFRASRSEFDGSYPTLESKIDICTRANAAFNPIEEWRVVQKLGNKIIKVICPSEEEVTTTPAEQITLPSWEDCQRACKHGGTALEVFIYSYEKEDTRGMFRERLLAVLREQAHTNQTSSTLVALQEKIRRVQKMVEDGFMEEASDSILTLLD